MSKVMLDNRIFNDSWFFDLSADAKWLFTFVLTNQSCNLIGCYELPLPIISSYTGLTPQRISNAFKELAHKVAYVDGWVIIKNYEKYNPMRNPSIEKSKENQLSALPDRISEIFESFRQGVDRVSEGVDTLQGNGIGKGKEIKGVVKGENKIYDLKDEDFEDISQVYNVPISFVRSKYDDMINWHEENPRKNNKANWKATLRNWVKRDAMERREHAAGKSKIAFIDPS